MNFLFDADFFMSNMHPRVKDSIPILIIHGLRESASQLQASASKWPNIKLATPFIRDRYGVHHSKVTCIHLHAKKSYLWKKQAMILFYRDSKTSIESAQIIIMTANMIPQD